MPVVSVVMPTLNAEKYLAEAIDSILKQTFSDFEFLIIDGGSVDKTVSIIKSYQDKRIRLLNGSGKNIAADLNIGLEAATGEYIARMDADDVALPERFAKQVDFLEKNSDVAILGSSVITIDAEGKEAKIWAPRERPKVIDILSSCVVPHPTVMMRREVIYKYDLKYDVSYNAAEDQELWSRAIRIVNFYNLKEPLLKYRVHGNNATIVREDEAERKLGKLETNFLQWLCSVKSGADIATTSFVIKNFFHHLLLKSVLKMKLFFLFPVLSIRYRKNRVYYNLFSKLPFLKLKVRTNRVLFFLFGVLPLLKVVYTSEAKKYFLFFVIPILKVE